MRDFYEKIDFSLLNIWLIIGVVGLGIFHFFTNLSVLDLNYKVAELKSTLDSISTQNKTLNFKYLESREVMFAGIGTQYVKAGKVEFIKAPQGLSYRSGREF